MMKSATRIALLFAFAAVMSLTARAQTPTIAADGVRNGASYTISGLPNSGIAQGSIMVIFGSNLGPANIVQVSSFPLPTSAGLAGTSVRVTVGGTSVNAIMLYTLASQVAAVLPSNTPVGTGTVTVTYNGATSNAAPITVLAGNWGSFTRNQGGTGPTIMQNFNSQSDQPFNTLLDSARPGQVITLWGTGLGPVSGNEAGQPLPGDMTGVNVKVFVGGREAAVQYRGRSGCCVGIDQIVFTVPNGVDGCHVPVSVQIGNVVSNITSMSVAANGGACSSPGSYTAGDLERARANGGLRIGSVGLNKTISRLTLPGLGNFDTKVDFGFGSFQRITLNQILQQDGSANALNPGACSVTVARVGGSGGGGGSAQFTGLDAGPAIALTGPNGPKSLGKAPNSTGIYSEVLSQTIPFGSAQPDYIVPGSYGFSSSGGADVGAFSTSLNVPANLVWSNEAQITTVNRANGQLITWNAGGADGFVIIAGSSVNTANTANVSFTCYERASAGQFTIPSSILLALPPSGNQAGVPTGFLFVGGFTNPGTFTASGLDIGVTSYSATVGKSLSYQ